MLRELLLAIYRRIPVIRELIQVKRTLALVQGELERRRAIDAIRMLDLELERQPRYADALRLARHGFQVNSQNGEDGILREILRRVGTTNRFFVEIGVGDGVENNTAFLLSQGWTGAWIDAGDAFLKTAARPDLAPALKTTVARVTRENVGEILKQLQVSAEFDVLSIDIDQNTYAAWEGLASFRPRVVVVEYNAALPPDLDWKVRYEPQRAWDGTQNFGASLKAFELLGRKLGYSLVGCEFTGVNAFFVRDDLVAGKFAAPFTAENHHEPPRYALVQRRTHPPAVLDRNE
jgi:hypothetical protein